MVKYHVNPDTGRPNQCHATLRDCKYAINGELPEHYETKEEAKQAAEKLMSDKHGVTNTLTKKNNRIKEYTISDPLNFKSFGTGNFRLVANNNVKYWGKDTIVEKRKCVDTPQQNYQYDDDDFFYDYEEIAVDGEIIGYVMKSDEHGFGFQTIEMINDPWSIHSKNFNRFNRMQTISSLVEHHKKYVSQPLELSDDYDYLGLYRKSPHVINVDDDTQVYLQSNKSSVNGLTEYYAFLVKNGKAVSYMKVHDYSSDHDDSDSGDRRNHDIVRCDVETRRTERRKGYAKELNNILEKMFDTTISSSGTYTELGFKAFGGNSPSDNDQKGIHEGFTVSPMNFVDDWDTLSYYAF